MARNSNTKRAMHLAGLAATAVLLGISTPVWAQTLYVSNASTNTLSMVPVDTSKPKVDIAVGRNPQAVAVSRDGRYAYTANASDNTVSAIDTATQSVIGTWATEDLPYAVAVSLDGSKLYVANNTSNSVSVLNATTGAQLQLLPVGDGPIGLTVSPNGDYLAVSHYDSTDAHIFDISGASAVAYATAAIGSWHYAAAFSADSSMAYFPTSQGYVPFDLSAKFAGARVSTGTITPHAMAIVGNDFYQTDYSGSGLYYGSLASAGPFNSVTVGTESTGVALNSAGSILYIAHYGTHGNAATGSVTAYPISNFASPVTYTVGGNPSGVAYSQYDFTPTPTAVPTLTEWAMILLGLVLAGFAALTLQRRRQAA